jgi:hypothetical protein
VVVVITLLVGRMAAGIVVVAIVGATILNKELLPTPLPLLAAHWPAYAQYWPTAQQMVPHGLSFMEESHEVPVTAATAAAVLVSAPK